MPWPRNLHSLGYIFTDASVPDMSFPILLPIYLKVIGDRIISIRYKSMVCTTLGLIGYGGGN